MPERRRRAEAASNSTASPAYGGRQADSPDQRRSAIFAAQAPYETRYRHKDLSAKAPADVIPTNHKFSTLAFDDCSEVQIAAPLELGPNLRAYPTAPFELPQHGREWIGTLRAGHFAEANLVIVVTRPSAEPGVLDRETRDLERELTGRLRSDARRSPRLQRNDLVLGSERGW
jgi:hypothetical protein